MIKPLSTLLTEKYIVVRSYEEKSIKQKYYHRLPKKAALELKILLPCYSEYDLTEDQEDLIFTPVFDEICDEIDYEKLEECLNNSSLNDYKITEEDYDNEIW